MSSHLKAEFGWFRYFFWPIHRYELKKFLPLLLMMFLVCFNYSILRNLKDAVIIPASGAEVIPFIKVWLILPMALLFTCLFAYLSVRFSLEKTIYIMTTGFLASYALFAFILYPNRVFLHPTQSADWIASCLPGGCKGLIEMYRNWTFTGFYVASELWGSVILSVIFWGFMNEITKVNEARRYYGVLSIWSNIATICAGVTANYFSGFSALTTRFPLGNDPWEQSMMILVSIVIVMGIVTMASFRWLSKNVLIDPSFDNFHAARKIVKTKKKLSLKESFSFLSNSKYLVCIAVVVIAYNLVINLVEVIWKDQLKLLYPDPADFYSFLNMLTVWTGVVSTTLAVFIVFTIDRFGWTKVALITPTIMGITAFSFFYFYFFQDSSLSQFMVTVTGSSPLAIVVLFGALQNCSSKATKYSVFDSTKEMAFIPLDHDVKLKGKAAIDGVGSRFGKSGGSLIHQGLLLVFSTISRSAPYVASILFLAIGCWFYAVRSLGKQFNSLVTSQGELPIDQTEELSTQAVDAVT